MTRSQLWNLPYRYKIVKREFGLSAQRYEKIDKWADCYDLAHCNVKGTRRRGVSGPSGRFLELTDVSSEDADNIVARINW